MRSSSGLYRTIRQRRIYEEVVGQITDLVARKKLQPGDKLPAERDLADELGVSRNAVREAVKALEQMRVVEARQGSGTFICDISLDGVAQWFSLFVQADISRHLELEEIREILDVEIAGRLALRASEEDLARLDERIAHMRAVVDLPEAFAREDVAFHVTMYRAMRNDVLLGIMQPIWELLGEAMRMSVQAPGSAASALRRHEELVRRIRARDAEGARQVMRETISKGEDRLIEAIKARGSSGSSNPVVTGDNDSPEELTLI